MIKIAVVDDENIICSYVEQSLLNLSKKYGISIETDVFNSGEDLIKTIKETFYDVIFLDIKMKDLSGIDISRIIRNTMGNEAIQIIYISGNTERRKRIITEYGRTKEPRNNHLPYKNIQQVWQMSIPTQ